MLATADKTLDFVLTLVFYVFGFLFGFYCVFHHPRKMRKAIAEGKRLANEKTARWVARVGMLMLVLSPIAFAFTVFLYVCGKW